MKIALYIEDGLEQVVLTPETETEYGIVNKLHDGSLDFEVYRGTFYGCRGGWMRHGETRDVSYSRNYSNDDRSTIIVLRPQPSNGEQGK